METHVILLIWMLIFALVIPAPAGAEIRKPIEPVITSATRLMIFSPHPDDETLGAGGLIQRVLKAGGRVRVVFVTSGDGFPEGVEKEDHITHPTAKDYRAYGEVRRQEALKVLATLGLSTHDAIFLGFPDGGLSYLRWEFRDDPKAYQSPFTLEKRPPPSEMIIPHADYNGQDLIKEIERVLTDFRPDIVATTPPEDQHPDHNSTYFFVREALTHLIKKHPRIKPKIFTFLIHFGQWPVAQGSGTGSRLDPPRGFPDEERWISFPLQPEEAEIKRRAILQYHSQMLVMGRFLLSFARSNELYIPEN
jgi:LmbE family N-acetylglucosaminyl deacetylase